MWFIQYLPNTHLDPLMQKPVADKELNDDYEVHLICVSCAVKLQIQKLNLNTELKGWLWSFAAPVFVVNYNSDYEASIHLFLLCSIILISWRESGLEVMMSTFITYADLIRFTALIVLIFTK